jgi:hypothetical protein
LHGVLEESGDDDQRLEPLIKPIVDMSLPPFDTYVEILTSARGAFHRRYLTQCLDSLLLKRRPGALLAQPRTKGGARRFVLDSLALEVMLQIAVLRPRGSLGFHTTEMRVDELLAFLRERYGLYIDRLPPGDGFADPTITDRAALRENFVAFTSRLREVGFYRDLSDAYVTQTVAPRYVIRADAAEHEGGLR